MTEIGGRSGGEPRRIGTLVRHAHILTMDDADRIIEDGAIAIEGGRIVDVGEDAAVAGRCRFTGVEVCPTTARIARLLHPGARVRCEDYTRSRLGGGFDLAVGNPPFSRRIVRPPPGSRLPPLALHDHFVAASVARLRPGASIAQLNEQMKIVTARVTDRLPTRAQFMKDTNMMLLTAFGAVALVLSAIGIYGVLAFGVAQRVREFGIRQALGADRSSILSLVLKQGLKTAGVGMVLGLAASVALARLLETLLFGVTPRDPAVFGAVTVVLLAVAMAACYTPARRATRVDPMVALRDS